MNIYRTNRLLFGERLVSQVLPKIWKEDETKELFLKAISQRMNLPLTMDIVHSCSHQKQDPWLLGSSKLHATLWFHLLQQGTWLDQALFQFRYNRFCLVFKKNNKDSKKPFFAKWSAHFPCLLHDSVPDFKKVYETKKLEGKGPTSLIRWNPSNVDRLSTSIW